MVVSPKGAVAEHKFCDSPFLIQRLTVMSENSLHFGVLLHTNSARHSSSAGYHRGVFDFLETMLYCRN